MSDADLLIRLPRETQIKVLLEVADCCADIVEDVDTIPGSADSGSLQGIKAVANNQICRLKNIVANLRADAAGSS
jgi:hypothetical protein